MEQALAGVPNLVRADAATLLRGLHGLVLEHATEETASLLAKNLNASGFPCEIVPQTSIPVLMPQMAFQRLELPADNTTPEPALVCRDSLGRAFFHPVSTIAVAAAGWIEVPERTRSKPAPAVHRRIGALRGSWFGTRSQPPREDEVIPAHTILRMEFFSLRQPHRMQATAERLTPFFVGDAAVVPHRREIAARELGRIAAGFPNLPLNRGFLRLWDEEFRYPSVHAFEEELRWQLARAAEGSRNRAPGGGIS